MYMHQNEAAEYLLTTPRKVGLYRRLGILKAVRFGKNYCYRREWLDQFAEEWAGYDLSSESKARLAINGRKWKQEHEKI